MSTNHRYSNWRVADLSASVNDEACQKENVVIIGAGWGGLSCANALASSGRDVAVTVVDAAPRVGGLVRDGFDSINGTRSAEAGQHGFWDSYYNIFRFLEELPTIANIDDVLTGYAEQGQYSPRGLEAVWPVYRDSKQLPTGLAQAFYTRFLNLSPLDRMTAIPLVLAFSEFDDSKEAWEKYDQVSFRDLCVKLGVSSFPRGFRIHDSHWSVRTWGRMQRCGSSRDGLFFRPIESKCFRCEVVQGKRRREDFRSLGRASPKSRRGVSAINESTGIPNG